jgi:hypothetical protein
MQNFQGLIPIVACATVVGLRWWRDNDIDATVYNIKKKHWYAILESALLIIAVILVVKG